MTLSFELTLQEVRYAHRNGLDSSVYARGYILYSVDRQRASARTEFHYQYGIGSTTKVDKLAVTDATLWGELSDKERAVFARKIKGRIKQDVKIHVREFLWKKFKRAS